ncbi:MAG: hypothetical protein CVU39_00030 [Chloroflexi bacterium HGW-Chloroflexi-10]|nr:MAG: hypothetical protein CVU39_00030 [Chloroflexi bacterium HGW-Chloroflexi-10]
MNFELHPLGEVADFINGKAFKPEEWETKGLPIIRIQNLTGSTNITNYFSGDIDPKYLIKNGDLLVSWSASLGVYIWNKENGVLNQHIFKVIPHKRIEKLYLYYAIDHILDDMKTKVHGSTMQHITREPFESSLIPLPPLSEQQRIAAILTKANRLRSLRRYARQMSDTYLQSVFLEMFGDPASNPKGYPTYQLKWISLKFSDGPFGSDLKTEHYVPSGVRIIRLQNVGVGKFIDDDKAFISEEHFQKISKHLCIPGDIIVGTLGDPNLRAFIQPNYLKSALNKADCVQIRVDKTKATSEFVCWLLNMPHTLKLATGMIHGQTRERINMGRLAELEVPIPNLQSQQLFSKIVKNHENLNAEIKESERQAEHLFQSLLQRAFSGEL